MIKVKVEKEKAKYKKITITGHALYDDYENLLQYGHQRNCEMLFESNRVVDPNNIFNNSDIVPLMINLYSSVV